MEPITAVVAFALAAFVAFIVGHARGKKLRPPRPVAEVWQDLSAAERHVMDLLLEESAADAVSHEKWQIKHAAENARKSAVSRLAPLRDELDRSRAHYTR